MRLVLHRRVRSDVDEIMDHYERAQHPELSRDFYRELRGFMLDAARRPGRYHSSKRTSGGSTSNAFPITSCIELWAIACGSSLSGTTVGILTMA